MSDLEDELLDPDPKEINLDEANVNAAAASANPDDITLLDPEKGEKSAREDQQTWSITVSTQIIRS